MSLRGRIGLPACFCQFLRRVSVVVRPLLPSSSCMSEVYHSCTALPRVGPLDVHVADRAQALAAGLLYGVDVVAGWLHGIESASTPHVTRCVQTASSFPQQCQSKGLSVALTACASRRARGTQSSFMRAGAQNYPDVAATSSVTIANDIGRPLMPSQMLSWFSSWKSIRCSTNGGLLGVGHASLKRSPDQPREFDRAKP